MPRKPRPKVKKDKETAQQASPKLLHWVREQVKAGPVLWADRIAVVDPESGATVMRDVRRLRELSLGVISCNDAKEWSRIARHCCPVGTILEDYNEARWANVYEDFKALVHNELTKSMLTEENASKAKLLLEVLERRDKEHWNKDTGKKVEVTNNPETKTTSITFQVVD